MPLKPFGTFLCVKLCQKKKNKRNASQRNNSILSVWMRRLDNRRNMKTKTNSRVESTFHMKCKQITNRFSHFVPSTHFVCTCCLWGGCEIVETFLHSTCYFGRVRDMSPVSRALLMRFMHVIVKNHNRSWHSRAYSFRLPECFDFISAITCQVI